MVDQGGLSFLKGVSVVYVNFTLIGGLEYWYSTS